MHSTHNNFVIFVYVKLVSVGTMRAFRPCVPPVPERRADLHSMAQYSFGK